VGTKALGLWDPETGNWVQPDFAAGVPLDPENPGHFSRYKDVFGENSWVPLDGDGKPLTFHDFTTAGGVPIPLDPVRVYEESNFLLLGIPTSF